MTAIPSIAFCETLCAYVCQDPSCLIVLRPANVKSHLQRKHQIAAGLAQEHSKALLKTYERKRPLEISFRYFKSPYPLDGEQPLPALPLLPLYDVIQCPFCSLYFKGVNSCRVHMRSKHSHHDNFVTAVQQLPEIPVMKGQCLFAGIERRFFPVTIPESLSREGNVKILPNSNDASKSSVKADDLSIRERSANMTCKILDIPSFLDWQKLTLDKAYNLSKVDRSYQSKLVEALVTYVQFFAERRPPIPLAIIEGMRIRNGDNLASFSLSIEMRSKRRYANAAARFVTLVLRLSESPLENFPVCEELVSVARSIVSPLKRLAKPALQSIHQFFRLLLLQKVRASKGEMVSIEGMFKILIAGYTCSLASKRVRVGDSEDASHTAAAMQYFCHIAALAEFFEYPVGFGIPSDEDESTRMNRIQGLLSTNCCSPAAYLRTVLKKAKALSAGESPNIQFVVCPTHPFCCFVDNIEVPLNSSQPGSIGYTTRRIMGKVRKSLREDLMRNYKIPANFLQTVLSFPDRLSNKEPGYFFGADGEAKQLMESWAEGFAKHLSNDENSIIELSKSPQESAWKPTSFASRWLRLVDEVSFLLYTLVHMCGGGPPRVTEMVEAKFKNLAGSRRNVFLVKKAVVLVGSYSKTSRQFTMPKPIARFLDRNTSELLLIFIVFIKPVQCFILDQSMVDVKATSHYLFCSSGEVMADDAVCKRFSKTVASEGLPLNISLYRQLRAGVGKAFLIVGHPGSDEELVFLQAGHTEATARVRYAGGDFHVGSLSLAKLEGFYKLSKKWHTLLGIDDDTETIENASKEDLQSNGIEILDLTGNSSTGIVNSYDAIGTSMIRPKRVHEQTTAKVRSDERISGIAKRVKLVDAPENGVSSSENGTLKQSVIRAAAKVIGVSSTMEVRFKSDAQRRAIFECAIQTIMAEYCSSMFVILPTGGGKTLCWAVPARREQDISDDLSLLPPKSLLVVPLIALQQDIVRKCKQYGIRCGKWDERFREDLAVVVCSIDIIFTDSYARYISSMSVKQQIARIIIDEAHLLLLWEDLRRFEFVGEKLRTSEAQSIPVVCLTATLPETMLKKLREVLQLDTSCMKLFRSRNTRPNIRYQVEFVPFSNTERMIAHCALEIVSELKEMKPEERLIAFCLTVADCLSLYEEVRKIAKACIYHGSMTLLEREENFNNWISNSSTSPVAMVATSAFSCGIDYPHVRTVLHVGGARSIVELAQESGRGGRDGLLAKNKIVFNPGYLNSKTNGSAVTCGKDPKWNMFGNLNDYLLSTRQCRREILESFLNDECRGPCQGEEAKCDICCYNEKEGWRNVCVHEGSVPHRKRVPALIPVSDYNAVSHRSSTQASNYTCEGEVRDDSQKRNIFCDNTHKQSSKGDFISEAKWKAKQISLLKCAVCVFNGSADNADSFEHNMCMRGKCFRCLESNASHQSKNCEVTPRENGKDGRCFFCGIPSKKGLHDNGSFNNGERCEWLVAKNLALLAFRDQYHRRNMLKLIPKLYGARGMRDVGLLMCGGKTRNEEVLLTYAVDYLYSTFIIGRLTQ